MSIFFHTFLQEIMIRNFTLILVIATLIALPSSYSQVTLQAGGGVGFVMAAGDFEGTTQDFYNGTAYGLSNGMNLHGKVRAGVLGFTLVGELGYASLENTGVATSDNKGKIDINQKVLSDECRAKFISLF